MKTRRFSLLAFIVLSAMFLPSLFGNHRTGTLALPELLLAGDFDGDGNLDLAVNVTGFDMAAIFRGNGHGGFTLQGHVKLDTLPKGLAHGDVNEDGHTDLVSCTAWGYTMRLLLGDGLGGFNSANELKGDGEPTRLVLRDFNRDGHRDIAVNAPDEGKIIIYFGDGKGNFAVPSTELEDYPNSSSLAAGDFNGDNNLDIVTTTRTGINPGTAHVAVLLGDGNGGFSQSAFLGVTSRPSSVAVGDLNGDTKLDFVVAGAEPHNTEGNFVSTFLGHGMGNFTLKQTINLGDGNLKGEIALGDFNEDGILDVAFPVTGDLSGNHSNTVLIFFGDGTGNLLAGPSVTVGQEPHSVITADFNKNGHLDLAVTNRTDGTISIFSGDGRGNFTLVTTLSVISPELNP
jgi:hypothetical protein